MTFRILYALIALCAMTISVSAQELNIISSMDENKLKPLIESFKETSGITLNFYKADINKTVTSHAPNGEYDVILAESPDLEIAKQHEILIPIDNHSLKVKTPLRDSEYYWVGYQYRILSIFYNPLKVSNKDLSSYEDLISPRWKGRLCSNGFNSKFSISFINWMIARKGESFAEEWVEGIKRNSVKPTKDKSLAQALYDGECDLYMDASYHYGHMLANPATRHLANAIKVYFPNQNDGGSFFHLMSVGIVNKTKHYDDSLKFVSFLTNIVTQSWFNASVMTYPVRDDLPLSRITSSYGAGQDGIKNGRPLITPFMPEYYVKFTPLAENIIKNHPF